MGRDYDFRRLTGETIPEGVSDKTRAFIDGMIDAGAVIAMPREDVMMVQHSSGGDEANEAYGLVSYVVDVRNRGAYLLEVRDEWNYPRPNEVSCRVSKLDPQLAQTMRREARQHLDGTESERKAQDAPCGRFSIRYGEEAGLDDAYEADAMSYGTVVRTVLEGLDGLERAWARGVCEVNMDLPEDVVALAKSTFPKGYVDGFDRGRGRPHGDPYMSSRSFYARPEAAVSVMPPAYPGFAYDGDYEDQFAGGRAPSAPTAPPARIVDDGLDDGLDGVV